MNRKIKSTVSRPRAVSSNSLNHNIPSKMAVGKVIKKSRLKKPYSQRSVPSGQPGGLWIKKYGLFYHKDRSYKKRSRSVSRLLIIMKKLSIHLQTMNLKNVVPLERLKS